jgi:outer membrane protein OmpA-like peptidoglycan-associated protein
MKHSPSLHKISTLAMLCVGAQTAHGEGFNSENFRPTLGTQSGILWETPFTQNRSRIGFANTLSYAVRPLEFGDGNNERLPITNTLVVNHLGFSYGIRSWLQAGASLPVALYANPDSADGYLRVVKKRDRESMFPGDLATQIKAAIPSPLRNVQAAIAATLFFPTGSREALLTDDSLKITIETPFSIAIPGSKTSIFLTPGYSRWESPDRIYTFATETSSASKLLQKSQSLLLAAGGRYWVQGHSNTPAARNIVVDAGLRGDFSDSKISFTDAASPVEWSFGVGYFLTRELSVHSAFGTGLGSGAGAPLSRFVAGVRYSEQTPLKPTEEELPLTMLSSGAYGENELAELMEQAKAEPVPPSLGDDENIILRLLVDGQIIDIGAISFDYNSAKMNRNAKATIELLFHELRRIAPETIKIEGHTDSVGSYNFNLALSKQRANTVRDELIRLGENPRTLETEGFSYKYPVASNATKEGRKQNRRIEVSVNGESFRKSYYSPEEESLMMEWIAPNGKKPTQE